MKKEAAPDSLIRFLDRRGPPCCPQRRISLRIQGSCVDVGCSSCGKKLFEMGTDHLKQIREADIP